MTSTWWKWRRKRRWRKKRIYVNILPGTGFDMLVGFAEDTFCQWCCSLSICHDWPPSEGILAGRLEMFFFCLSMYEVDAHGKKILCYDNIGQLLKSARAKPYRIAIANDCVLISYSKALLRSVLFFRWWPDKFLQFRKRKVRASAWTLIALMNSNEQIGRASCRERVSR